MPYQTLVSLIGTCVMGSDPICCEGFLPPSTQPSPEIWFETEHFENLSFWAPSSRFHLSPLELEMDLEKTSHGFWKFGKFNCNPFEEMNKTHK